MATSHHTMQVDGAKVEPLYVCTMEAHRCNAADDAYMRGGQ